MYFLYFPREERMVYIYLITLRRKNSTNIFLCYGNIIVGIHYENRGTLQQKNVSHSNQLPVICYNIAMHLGFHFVLKNHFLTQSTIST